MRGGEGLQRGKRKEGCEGVGHGKGRDENIRRVKERGVKE